MIKIISHLFTLGVFVLFSASVFANGNCTNKAGPNQIHLETNDLKINIPGNNTTGFSVDNAFEWHGYSTTFSCDCTTHGNWVFSSKMYIPEDGGGWYKYNEYLDAKLTITQINGVGSAEIPFTDLVASDASCHNTEVTYSNATGTNGFLSLKIIKPFVGKVMLPNIKIADLYTCVSTDGKCSTSSPPTDEYYFSGSITVPQNCVINVGQAIKVDLGPISRNKFKIIGQKAEGSEPKVFNVPIQCNNMDGAAALTLRLEGTPSSGVANALQSDNPDVGVVVADSNGTPLIPNDTGSIVPFRINENSYANVALQAYAVGTTGNIPESGFFTSLSYLRVDFP
ncbi:fimbrial protein (plasmid) [Klebsiella aerogenes]